MAATPDKPPPGLARLVVVGANHRSSSPALREGLYVTEDTMGGFLERLRRAGLAQAIVLSTCDRIEVQAAHPDPAAAAAAIVGLFAEQAGVRDADMERQLYRIEEGAALRHIFAVAASLDSLVVGEPQILGQLKSGHRAAATAGMTGAELEAVLQSAYATAKKIRSETAIAEGPVSIAAAAVELAREIHGDLERCAGLLIGSGEMGELLVDHLRAAGLYRLTVSGPLLARAEETARRLKCHHAAFDDPTALLAKADICVTAQGGGQTLVAAAHLDAALKLRRRRPIFVIDLGVPGDVDPTAESLDGVFLSELDDLEGVPMATRATRETAAKAAWAILDAEVAAFERGRAERQAVPLLSVLRRHFEDTRNQVLESATDADAAEATRRLINRLLHDPSLILRAIAANPSGREDMEAAARLLRRLFNLDGGGNDR